MSLAEITKSRNIQVETDVGLWSADGTYLGNFSDHLLIDGATIEYDYCRKIKASCRLSWDTELPFTSYRVGVAMRVTDLTTKLSKRMQLGRYLLENPIVSLDFEQIWSADGYDLLTILDTPVPYSWRVPDGTSIRTAIENILVAAETNLEFEGWYVDSTTRGDRVWPLDGRVTWLDIINELLISAGWRSIWLTREGYLTSSLYQDTSTLNADFFYDSTLADSTVAYGATVETDVWGIPNQWVFIADIADPNVGSPSEGNGIVRLRNDSIGPSSISNRGRVINRVEKVDATTQDALHLEATQQRATDIQSVQKIVFNTVPNPQLWHRDIIKVNFPPHVINRRAVVQKWTLPLGGQDMTVEANLI